MCGYHEPDRLVKCEWCDRVTWRRMAGGWRHVPLSSGDVWVCTSCWMLRDASESDEEREQLRELPF